VSLTKSTAQLAGKRRLKLIKLNNSFIVSIFVTMDNTRPKYKKKLDRFFGGMEGQRHNDPLNPRLSTSLNAAPVRRPYYYAPAPNRRGHKAMMLSDVCLTFDVCRVHRA